MKYYSRQLYFTHYLEALFHEWEDDIMITYGY